MLHNTGILINVYTLIMYIQLSYQQKQVYLVITVQNIKTVADHRQIRRTGRTCFYREKGELGRAVITKEFGELGVQWRLPVGWTAAVSDWLGCWGVEGSFLPPA